MSYPILTIIANPYDTSSPYFEFSEIEEYQYLFEKYLEKRGTEEYEFDLIDADETASELWNILQVNQCNLSKFFELYDSGKFDLLEPLLKFKICIQHFGMDIEQALETYEDVYLYEGTPEDYAEEYMNDCFNIPTFLENYIDYEKFARDLECNGDIIHFEKEGYVLTNPHGI